MTDPNPIDRLREALGKMGTEIETPEWYEDAQEALAQLETEREADRRDYLMIAEALGAIHDQSMGPSYPGTVREVLGCIDALKGELRYWEHHPVENTNKLLREANNRQTERVAAAEARIRELESQLSALRAPETAPVDGELAKALDMVRRVSVVGFDLEPYGEMVCAAAEKWGALRWRPASEANHEAAPLLLVGSSVNDGSPTYGLSQDGVQHAVEHVEFWLPLDALPEPPTEESDDG